MMIAAVISGFLLGAVAPWIVRAAGERAHWLLALLPAAIFVYLASFLPVVADGGAVRLATPWVPQLAVALSFYVDGLSLVFGLLISGIGAFIVIYAGGYLHGDPQIGRFYVYLLSFMAAMLGVVLADNVITLFVFWELTSLTSFLLIGYYHDQARSRRAAVQALIVTGAGGLAMLAGLLIMGAIGGSYELSELLVQSEVLRENPLYVPMVVLLLAGAFSKSAQFPLHFWLPNAMEAPTPVSAYLHSSTMVKAGVYLVARLSPGVGGTDLWFWALVVFGALTMLTGAILALRQTDLKLVLAYTTVAGLGTLVMLIGLGDPLAYKAAAVFLITHAFYKGALFMSAGAIDHETGTRNPLELGGLMRVMPVSFAAAALAGLSMSGIIPFVGFVAKEVMYEATLHLGPLGGVAVTAAAIAGNALTIVAAGIVVVRPFAGARKDTPKHPHEAPPSLYLGPWVLAVLGLLAGILYPVTAHWVAAPVMASMEGAAVDPHAAELYLWHGFKTPLFLSLLTLALGIAGYLAGDRLRKGIGAALRAIGWGWDLGYDQLVAGLERLAAAQVRVQQTGYLRHYVMAVFCVFSGFALLTFAAVGGWPGAFEMPAIKLLEFVALALMTLAALAATTVTSRIAAVAAVGVVGYSVALIFLIFSAPDLAFTQFMVETLVVVILVLVLMRVPLEVSMIRNGRARLGHAAIAAITGGVFTLALMAVVQGEMDLRLTEYFYEKSVPAAHGHNVVNVILVDFRALDTLGEIFVVTVAGLSTFALLRLVGGRRQARGEGGA